MLLVEVIRAAVHGGHTGALPAALEPWLWLERNSYLSSLLSVFGSLLSSGVCGFPYAMRPSCYIAPDSSVPR